MTNLKYGIADLVSKVLSPPVIACVVTVLFSLCSLISLGFLNPFTRIFVGFIFLAVLPTIPVIYFAKKGVVDLYVSKMGMRTPFLLAAIASYALASVIFWSTQVRTMFLLSVGYVCVASAIMVTNFFWKVSIHSAGVAGPATAAVYVFGTRAMPLFILLIPVIWARVKLEAHTLIQVIGGIVLSILVTLGACLVTLP